MWIENGKLVSNRSLCEIYHNMHTEVADSQYFLATPDSNVPALSEGRSFFPFSSMRQVINVILLNLRHTVLPVVINEHWTEEVTRYGTRSQ